MLTSSLDPKYDKSFADVDEALARLIAQVLEPLSTEVRPARWQPKQSSSEGSSTARPGAEVLGPLSVEVGGRPSWRSSSRT